MRLEYEEGAECFKKRVAEKEVFSKVLNNGLLNARFTQSLWNTCSPRMRRNQDVLLQLLRKQKTIFETFGVKVCGVKERRGNLLRR